MNGYWYMQSLWWSSKEVCWVKRANFMITFILPINTYKNLGGTQGNYAKGGGGAIFFPQVSQAGKWRILSVESEQTKGENQEYWCDGLKTLPTWSSSTAAHSQQFLQKFPQFLNQIFYPWLLNKSWQTRIASHLKKDSNPKDKD